MKAVNSVLMVWLMVIGVVLMLLIAYALLHRKNNTFAVDNDDCHVQNGALQNKNGSGHAHLLQAS